VEHWEVPPESVPALAALKQALFWTEQDLWIAAPAFTKVSPSTENGRALPAVDSTGGAAPPRVPVKVWTLVVPVATSVADATAAEGVVAVAGEVAAAATVMVEVTSGAQAEAAAELAATAGTVVAAIDELEAAPVATATPATAALISAGVASSMRRFSEKMHPGSSSATSQVLPAPVVSPMVPGANVPVRRAS